MKIVLVPTEGRHQKSLEADLVRETDTLWIVKPENQNIEWRFSKKDRLRTGYAKSEFPRYKITQPRG